MHETWDTRTWDTRHEKTWGMRRETRDLSSFVSCIMPHASWLMFPVSCLLRYETWPPLPPWGEGGGDRRHEAWKHEPWATRSETWKLEPWKNTMHETRVTRRKPPPPWDMVCTKRVDSEGGVFMEVLVHFWPFTSWPSSKYSVFIPVHKLVPTPPDSFFFLPVLYILSSWEGGGGEGGGD